MHDTALRKRVVVLVIAALLSVAGASVASAATANDAQAFVNVNTGAAG